jgi:hypothetical protein
MLLARFLSFNLWPMGHKFATLNIRSLSLPVSYFFNLWAVAHKFTALLFVS